MHGRLDPTRMYPANAAGVTARTLRLANGLAVRLVEAGPLQGRPLVLLHGWGGSAYMFSRGVERLARDGFRVMVPDLRGFGISDKPRQRGAYSLDTYVGDLLGLLDACGLARAALVGHSMGGAVALHTTVAHPSRVASLALINPVGLAEIPGVALGRLIPRRVMDLLGRRAVPRWIVELILRRVAYSRPELVTARDVDEYWAPSQFDGYAYALRATLGEFDWAPAETEQLLSARVPTTVLLGSADRLIPPEAAARAARGLPNAKVVVLAGGHCVHEELPDLAYPLLAQGGA